MIHNISSMTFKNVHVKLYLVKEVLTCTYVTALYLIVYLLCQDSWRSSYSRWRTDRHLSCADVGEGNTRARAHTRRVEGRPLLLRPAFWLVFVTLCPQALDLLLDRMKKAGLNFSEVRALSGGGQVGVSPSSSNTFGTSVTVEHAGRSGSADFPRGGEAIGRYVKDLHLPIVLDSIVICVSVSKTTVSYSC